MTTAGSRGLISWVVPALAFLFLPHLVRAQGQETIHISQAVMNAQQPAMTQQVIFSGQTTASENFRGVNGTQGQSFLNGAGFVQQDLTLRLRFPSPTTEWSLGVDAFGTSDRLNPPTGYRTPGYFAEMRQGEGLRLRLGHSDESLAPYVFGSRFLGVSLGARLAPETETIFFAGYRPKGSSTDPFDSRVLGLRLQQRFTVAQGTTLTAGASGSLTDQDAFSRVDQIAGRTLSNFVTGLDLELLNSVWSFRLDYAHSSAQSKVTGIASGGGDALQANLFYRGGGTRANFFYQRVSSRFFTANGSASPDLREFRFLLEEDLTRQIRFRMGYNHFNNNVAAFLTNTSSNLGPFFSLTYDITPELSLNANYRKRFRFVDPRLTNQVTNTLDGGLTYRFPWVAVSIGAGNDVLSDRLVLANNATRSFFQTDLSLVQPLKLWSVELRPSLGGRWNNTRDNRLFSERSADLRVGMNANFSPQSSLNFSMNANGTDRNQGSPFARNVWNVGFDQGIGSDRTVGFVVNRSVFRDSSGLRNVGETTGQFRFTTRFGQ